MSNPEEEPKRIDYQPPATLESDAKVLQSMIFADVRGDTQVIQCSFYKYSTYSKVFIFFLLISNVTVAARKTGVILRQSGRSL